MALLGCGHTLSVVSMCNGKSVSVQIADCGPASYEFCGEKTCCGGKCGTDRLIDLTPSAFSSIASLSSGLTAVTVS
jgi:rare lipoprotein A (peptidoglycan hydrolase)